nr:MAG TPA: hypothetical protein [Caudoviricetes sp.]
MMCRFPLLHGSQVRPDVTRRRNCRWQGIGGL